MQKIKMEFKELEILEDYLEKYLNYKGYNLWKLSEAATYENFIKFPKKKNSLNKNKDFLFRYLVKLREKQKEKEKTEEVGKNREIFMVVYGLSPINTFKPILKKIKEKIKVVRYDPPSEEITKTFLRKNNLAYSNIDNYMDENIEKEVKKAKRWLARQWKLIKKDKKLKLILKENYALIKDALEYFCYTRKSYLEIIRLIELYGRAYELEKPRLVIVSDDANFYGKTAVSVAKRKNINTICIQHGQLEGNVVVKDGADKILVNGYEDKRYLISQGIEKEKIKIVGQIRYDDIPKKMKLSKKNLCKKLGLDPDKKIIIYSYQKPIASENIIENALTCFLEEIKKLKNKEDYEIAITMRPDTPITNQIKNSKIRLLPGANIQELAVCSDMLITAFSTAAIEFVLMNKPAIAINIGLKHEDYIDYAKLGVGFKIIKKEDFLPALDKCLYDKNFKEKFKKAREEFIQDFSYKLDGKAVERILREINL